ncbi:MAG: sugar phosphate isomerase/epimerase family protein [Elusimicrobiota bacterium]
MKKPSKNYFQLGIIHPMAYPETGKGEGPVVETFTAIAKDEFFDAIEFRRHDHNPAIREQLKKIVVESGITPVIAGQPPLLGAKLNLNALDEPARVAAVADVKKSVDEAYYMGARILAILSGPMPASPEEVVKAKDALVKSVVEICNYAKEKKTGYVLTVSLETFDFDIDKKCLIGPTVEAVEFAKIVRKMVDNFGLTLDLSHLPLLRETSKHALKTAKDYLVHVHIGNCIMKDTKQVGYGDQHPRFGISGGENGVNELYEFLKQLKDIGYFDKRPAGMLPIISFEVKPLAGESSELVIANAKRALLAAWDFKSKHEDDENKKHKDKKKHKH